MTDRIHVFLSVGEFAPAPPSEITELMGLEPTEMWERGEPVPGHPTAHRTFSRWTLESPLERSKSFEDHLDALLLILEARADQIRRVKERFAAGIGCAAYFRSVNPGFHISETQLARLAALGLSLDFDLYCLGAGSDEEEQS